MNCKNCNFSLRTDYSFCPDCGAKVIHERITFKGLVHDFVERYFNVDNTFLRTITHMLIKPEVVILGYLNGIRRKYLNPASLLAIALTLSGLTLFVMKSYAWEMIDFEIINGNGSAEANRKMSAANMEYSTFIFLGYIPILALAGLIALNAKRLSFVENILAAIYILANWSIFMFPITLVALLAIPEYYLLASTIGVLFMATYSVYVYWRLNTETRIGTRMVQAMAFLMLFVMGFFGLAIFTFIINLLLGVIEFKDFLPPGALD